MTCLKMLAGLEGQLVGRQVGTGWEQEREGTVVVHKPGTSKQLPASGELTQQAPKAMATHLHHGYCETLKPLFIKACTELFRHSPLMHCTPVLTKANWSNAFASIS